MLSPWWHSSKSLDPSLAISIPSCHIQPVRGDLSYWLWLPLPSGCYELTSVKHADRKGQLVAFGLRSSFSTELTYNRLSEANKLNVNHSTLPATPSVILGNWPFYADLARLQPNKPVTPLDRSNENSRVQKCGSICNLDVTCLQVCVSNFNKLRME